MENKEWDELRKNNESLWVFVNNKRESNETRIQMFEEIQRLIRKIASYCYAEVVMETTSGAWCIYFEDIASFFEVPVKTIEDLKETINFEILKYEGVSDIEYQAGECFDINMFTDYCVNDIE